MSENTRGGSGRYSVREGMDVLDQNGDKIGKAGETMAGGRYFNVDAGFLGMKEYYVPLDAVTEVSGDAVYVNTTKDRLGSMGWDRHPEEQSTSATDVRGGTRTTDVRGGSQTGERMQLRQEELQARKEQVETGRVQIGKDVVEEQRTLEVPVTREEVTIDRRQVERRPSDTPIGRETEDTIRVPVREERVEVEKKPVVYEEVGIGKREVTESQQVSDTVRREEARIQRQGDVNIQGWDEAMPQYRQRWQQRSSRGGGRWEDAEPAYRYGHGLRNRPEYKGRSWTDVEPQVRQDWERQYPNTPWDRARDDVRETWDE